VPTSRAELLDHRIDRFGRSQKLALEGPPLDFESHGLAEVPLRDGSNHTRDLAARMYEILQ
jgi:hypothetical protein